MKMKKYIFILVVIAALVLIPVIKSCGGNEPVPDEIVDAVKPDVQLLSPGHQEQFTIGEDIELKIKVNKPEGITDLKVIYDNTVIHDNLVVEDQTISIATNESRVGRLNVLISYKDKAGKEQKIRIEASSGLSDAEIEKMKQEAEANADADAKKKEEIDKLNQADSLIFQTEKSLKEYGDKLPEDKKGPIEEALAELKTAHEAKDIAGIDAAMEKLNTVFQAASQEMYQQTGEQPGADAGAAGGDAGGDAKSGDEEVTDVDFEEV